MQIQFNLWFVKRKRQQLYIDAVPVMCYVTIWFWYFHIITTDEAIMLKNNRSMKAGAKARAKNVEDASALMRKLIQDLRGRASEMALRHVYNWPEYAQGESFANC